MKKICYLTAASIWVICLSFFVYFSLHLELPQTENEFILYFKEEKNDLKYLIAKCLNSASKSIYISSFGIGDKEIVKILECKGDYLPITIAFDPKENNLLPGGNHIELHPYTKRGLMHRKVVGIDNELLLLGSTNLTPLALKIHRNFIFCIRSKKLYSALEENRFLQTKTFSYYPLPESSNHALNALLQEIQSAKTRIFVCIYTFTHQKIADALIDAKNRGVDVRIYIDRGMALGTSKDLIATLQNNHLFVATHLGSGLLHHKCALIDNQFIFGSANWTKAAFTKNEEYLLFLNQLTDSQLNQIERFFFHLHKTTSHK